MNHKRVMILFVVLFSIITRSLYAQVITSMTPGSAMPGKTLDVLIRGLGTHFQNGVSVADFGNDIIVRRLAVSNALTATATIEVGSAATTGFRTVRMRTNSEVAEIENEFEVFSNTGDFRANIEILPIETISLSDLDLTSPKNSPILFFVNIYNDGKGRNLTINVFLSSQARGQIGKISMPKKEAAANAYLRFTNRDFTYVDLNGTTGDKFLDEVKKLGTFPPDDYKYKLEILEGKKVLTTDEDINVVTNTKANPELIVPGNTFDQPVETIYTSLPLFQWFGQMNEYDLSLYEVRNGQTPEEAVRNIAVFRQQNITSSNLLYPNYAEKLISGKTYAWQVLGKITSSKGAQYLPSEVFRFTYIEPGGGGSSTNTTKVVSKIEINPQSMDVSAGQSVQFFALYYDQDGNLMTQVTPQWSITPANGSITTSGLYTAGKQSGPVAVLVKAGSNSASEFAIVKVQSSTPTPAGQGDRMMRNMIRQLFGLPGQ